jgi:DNA-binding NtrC family response regulator
MAKSASSEKRFFIGWEKQYIIEVLKVAKGNKSEAARILGITRSSLWRKLKEIDMSYY